MTNALVVRDTPDPVKWESTAADWLAKRRSERTRRAYHDALGLLVAWAGVPAWDITPAHVAGWVLSMRATGASDATIALRLAAVGTFYATAVDARLLDVSPVDGIERPKVEPYGKAEALKRDQVTRVLASIDRTTPAGRRDYCMMLMSLTMALRRAEVVSILRGDIRAALDGGLLLAYRPKGGDERTRRLPVAVADALRAVLSDRGDLEPAAPLFVAHDRAAGHRDQVQPITAEAWRQRVATYTRAATGTAIAPHALRHSAAVELWEKRRDLLAVSRLLGHANAATTEIYLRHFDDDRHLLGDDLAASFGAA